MTPDADVAIVGAGPAGAAAACHFSRAGFRVALLDTHRFPRDKVCGDFVGPWALEELDRLGLSCEDPFRSANKIRRATLHLNGDEVVAASIPHLRGLRDYGLCIPRAQMDDALVKASIASGACMLHHARVTRYEADTNGVTVYYQEATKLERLRTRLLVGADGSTSLIARILRGIRSPRRDRIIAVRAYFEDVRGTRDEASLYANSSVFPGYYWLFPSGDKLANVGIGILLETWPPNDEQLGSCLSALIRSDSAMHARLGPSRICGKIAGWPLATFNPYLPIVADRVALIGDAAGLINPLNGEGIQYAFQSARWCFETLSDALACDMLSASRLAQYQARVSAEMRLDMAVSRLLIDFTRNRALNKVWLSILKRIGMRAAVDSEYAAVFGGVLAGIVKARQLLAMPFMRRTLTQARAVSGSGIAAAALRACISMAAFSAQNPTAVLDWGSQCFGTMLELARLVQQPKTAASN